MSNNFKDVFKKIQKAVEASTKQALSKAATSTRAKFAKDASAELGVPSKKIKARTKVFKATNAGVTLSIGTQVQLAAQDFKTNKVKLGSSRGPRTGVTYTIPSQGKLIVPAGVKMKGKGSGKDVVLTNTGNRKYKTVRVDGFEDKVKELTPDLEKHLSESFEKNFKSKLDYNLKKK